MSFVVADRVQETTLTTGTGSITTTGVAATQSQTFASGIGNGNVTNYCILSGDGTNWETGQGTITVSGTVSVLTRTDVFSSSNTNAAIALTGVSTVFCDLPASQVGQLQTLTVSGQTTLGATPTTSPVIINAGTVVPPTMLTGTVMEIWDPNTGNARFVLDAIAGGALYSGRRADGTAGSPTGITTNDVIMSFQAFGFDGTTYSSGTQGSFSVQAAEPWSSTAHGTQLIFSTTHTGSTTLTEAMRVSGGGNILVGTTADAGSGHLQVAGTAAVDALNINGGGVISHIGTGLSISGGTLSATGTGSVTSLVAGAGLTGGTITTSGTIALEASQMIRTVPFPFVGLLANAGQYNITLTQAGTLLANGGSHAAYVPINPAATQTIVLKTVNSGTINTQGTISISTAGSVTWPTFSAVNMAAGDSIQMNNQATADASFANACLSLQFEVT